MIHCYLYSHHVFGIGHLRRAALIAETMAESGYRVTLLSSGVYTAAIPIGEHIRYVQLPAEFKPFANCMYTVSVDPKLQGDALYSKRIEKVTNLFQNDPPGIFITEFFPFGAQRLNKTLIPILEHIKQKYPKCSVVCSARDIPIYDVENNEEKDVRILNSLLNKYYDLVCIHAPKELSSFSNGDSFFEGFKPNIPVLFTGYVVDKKAIESVEKLQRGKPRILITVGGGRDGVNVINRAIQAIESFVSSHEIQVDIVFEPFSTFKPLERPNYTVYQQVPRLIQWIGRSLLTICMAGSTLVEVTITGTPAVVFPRETTYEQKARACKIRGTSARVEFFSLQTPLQKITFAVKRLFAAGPKSVFMDTFFDGAQNTVKMIEEMRE